MCLAIPGQVLHVEGDDPLLRQGTVDFGGVRKQVSFAYTPEVKPGQYVLVHVGFAISVVNEEEARKTWEALEQLGELRDLEPPG